MSVQEYFEASHEYKKSLQSLLRVYKGSYSDNVISTILFGISGIGFIAKENLFLGVPCGIISVYTAYRALRAKKAKSILKRNSKHPEKF